MRLQLHPTALDSFALSSALQACARSGEPRTGEAIHAHVVKSGFVADLFMRTALVEMYAKAEGAAAAAAAAARKAFDEMPERDVFSYNVMLAAYVARGDVAGARRLFDDMPERDLVSWNTMLHGHATSGDADAARAVFDAAAAADRRDAFSWSSMISAYARAKRPGEALELFAAMRSAGVAPDAVAMVAALSACGDAGALRAGSEIHELIERNGVEVDLRLGTALVDMYAKCGDIDRALGVFRALTAKDVLAWSSMILGLANHGLGKLALEFFSEMVSGGVEPNGITFVGVLSACVHAGLVREGRDCFDSMESVYGVSPAVEHYGCMVDLLGRAGRIEEARELVRGMPFAPDAVVWRALLGACRIHRNVETAEEAIANLVKLEPRADGHYVLLSNIYAQADKWDGVAEMRRTIKRNNIRRVPGSSAIEVGKAIHRFVAGDRSHPLGEMIERLKEAGYRPMTSLVLREGIDERSKERLLAEHSEKLAIAFGLLATPSESTVRITKNLRVCEDCHSAIKLVSLVYDRKLIVRDRNRFHHFSEGECSCGDYW
ncbi:pentatricopeptide repeat-containing protein At5g66520-like [Ananas comosus]|uniref:Pentatricopeptide repeat-containing protein At5g66520-like n=1 Tax=Ananas comosus TaxID=4615 RepID=A0A6P5GHB7_ANACO|nr:pentatricopeptide repeat-containing protein At5g66520-like [Ananas comosus]XP_020108045.1 pentatricopeptide repeat-containing protein At5g66520-like [Ananas comosus]XP_020108046.1 pentatricopeptide repeat-containing protein At5g66520-like [Ananas comosus]